MIETLRFAKLHPNAKPPFRKNSTDAGIDFYSIETAEIPPHSMKIIHTGIGIEIPQNYFLLIKPKSKNNHLVGAGVIDAFYQPGEIMIKVTNISGEPMIIKEGDAIGQGVYIPIETPIMVEVDIDQLKNNSTRSTSGGIVTQSDREKQILKELGF